MIQDSIKATISENYVGQRLDKILCQIFPQFSRAYIQDCIKSGSVYIDGALITDASKKVQKHCTVELEYKRRSNDSYSIQGEDIPIDVLYEDEYILVINKQPGLVCHPAPGHKSGTLVNALVNKFQLSNMGGIMRPGIVHRLDKDTSGLLLVAKTNEAHITFANLFANSKGSLIKRKYTCVVFGNPSNKIGSIQTYIMRHPKNRQMFTTSKTNGKLAITLYTVENSYYFSSTKALSIISCELLTGRTHQIRVHMKHIGCPLVGDQVYCKSKIESVYPDYIRHFPRQALHSRELSFIHPFTKKHIIITAPFPEDIVGLLSKLK